MWGGKNGFAGVNSSECQKGLGVELIAQGRDNRLRIFFRDGDRYFVRRHTVVRRNRKTEFELVDTTAWSAPQPNDVVERAHGKGILVEVQLFVDVDILLGEYPV